MVGWVGSLWMTPLHSAFLFGKVLISYRQNTQKMKSYSRNIKKTCSRAMQVCSIVHLPSSLCPTHRRRVLHVIVESYMSLLWSYASSLCPPCRYWILRILVRSYIGHTTSAGDPQVSTGYPPKNTCGSCTRGSGSTRSHGYCRIRVGISEFRRYLRVTCEVV